MSVRMIIGIVATAGVSALGLLSSVTSYKIVDKVNSRLPKERQFSPFGWWAGKTLRLHSEYRRLFPDGNLVVRFWTITAMMFACLLALAWTIGFSSPSPRSSRLWPIRKRPGFGFLPRSGDSPRAADFRDQRAVIFRQRLLGRISNTNCVNVEHHRSDMLPD